MTKRARSLEDLHDRLAQGLPVVAGHDPAHAGELDGHPAAGGVGHHDRGAAEHGFHLHQGEALGVARQGQDVAGGVEVGHVLRRGDDPQEDELIAVAVHQRLVAGPVGLVGDLVLAGEDDPGVRDRCG